MRFVSPATRYYNAAHMKITTIPYYDYEFNFASLQVNQKKRIGGVNGEHCHVR